MPVLGGVLETERKNRVRSQSYQGEKELWHTDAATEVVLLYDPFILLFRFRVLIQITRQRVPIFFLHAKGREHFAIRFRVLVKPAAAYKEKGQLGEQLSRPIPSVHREMQNGKWGRQRATPRVGACGALIT
jgi:hypothetical protein